MFNLYQIITGAQGGQALDNLAQQYGVPREQVDSAIQALVPALSTAFMAKTAQPGGLGEIAGAMDDDQHKQAYADPAVAQDPAAQQKGSDIAGSIFGNGAILQQVAEQAAKYSGIPEATIQQMLPTIVSIVLGGVATSMHNQGLGGILGQLGGGGFADMLSKFGGTQAGGFPGMMGNVLGGLFGGGQHASPQQPIPQAGPASGFPGMPPMPGMPGGPGSGAPMGGLPPMVQAGMEALGKIFQAGVAPHAGFPGNLAQDINRAHGQG